MATQRRSKLEQWGYGLARLCVSRLKPRRVLRIMGQFDNLMPLPSRSESTSANYSQPASGVESGLLGDQRSADKEDAKPNQPRTMRAKIYTLNILRTFKYPNVHKILSKKKQN